MGVYFENTYDSDLRSGAEGTFYLPVLYNGNGTYYVEFDSYDCYREVQIELNK